MKQTGPERTVKGLSRVGLVALLAFVGGCSNASEWHNPAKSEAELHADMDICDKTGEEDALLKSGRPRADTAPPGGPTAGSFGRSPMQMHDQDATARDFHSSYDSCMESKGYTRK